MKRKLISLFCTAALVLSSSALPALAADVDGGLPEISTDTIEASVELTERNYDLSAGGAVLADLSEGPAFISENSITNQYTGVITEQGTFQYVLFNMYEGQIVQSTLTCPNNSALDYDLMLCTVADDGTLTPIAQCNLGTYIDPATGKTADEGLAYIHNQANPMTYAILVMATVGSSSTEEFALTLSLDVAGSYDSNEPNDNPFTATALRLFDTSPSVASAVGSLNVPNDQDWYSVTTTAPGVYELDAGNYDAEAYYVTTGNKMVQANKNPSGYYVLGKGTYYIKVYSSAPVDSFVFGDYAFKITDQSKYSTMKTAFDYHYWDMSSYRPDPIPWGQTQAFYKFSINTEDKMYAKITLPSDGSELLIGALNSSGQTLDMAYSANAGDIITPSIGSKFIAVNVDGTQVSDGVVYLQVVYGNPMSFHYSPFLSRRTATGNGEFKFTGSCSNSGNSISNAISLNLTNNPQIPPQAIVSGVTTKGSVSPSVGGINHMLNPGNRGWLTSSGVGVGTGFYRDVDETLGIGVKQVWQFKYAQTAFASTSMRNISVSFDWVYDLQYTNYELFK